MHLAHTHQPVPMSTPMSTIENWFRAQPYELEWPDGQTAEDIERTRQRLRNGNHIDMQSDAYPRSAGNHTSSGTNPVRKRKRTPEVEAADQRGGEATKRNTIRVSKGAKPVRGDLPVGPPRNEQSTPDSTIRPKGGSRLIYVDKMYV